MAATDAGCDAEAIDGLALRIHTDACIRALFRSKPISRAGGLAHSHDHHRGPLLLAWGEHDVTAVHDRAALSLSEGRELCRTQVALAPGHWVHYERADQINNRLLAWLDETSSKDSG